MKKIMFAILVVWGVSAVQESKAQISVNINIGSQPNWGPTGYNHVDFYYLPDINAYYDVTKAQYIYQNGARWTYVSSLPARYRNYDIYKAYKVVINEPRPFYNNKNHISQYARFKGNHSQQNIRDHQGNQHAQTNGNRQYEKPGSKYNTGNPKNMNQNNQKNKGQYNQKNNPQQHNQNDAHGRR